ncbi:MAG TPA: hypothetical protein VFB30_16155 [Spirochaetia bacterium]|nr:hypothetical protein [Spirochaetia bacterium]
MTIIIDWRKPKTTSKGARYPVSILERFTLESIRPATFNVAVVTDRPIKAD